MEGFEIRILGVFGLGRIDIGDGFWIENEEMK